MEKQAKPPRQKRIEPVVKVTIIRCKPEDDPARYAGYRAWMDGIIRKALSRPDQPETFNAECAPVSEDS